MWGGERPVWSADTFHSTQHFWEASKGWGLLNSQFLWWSNKMSSAPCCLKLSSLQSLQWEARAALGKCWRLTHSELPAPAGPQGVGPGSLQESSVIHFLKLLLYKLPSSSFHYVTRISFLFSLYQPGTQSGEEPTNFCVLTYFYFWWGRFKTNSKVRKKNNQAASGGLFFYLDVIILWGAHF